MRFNSVRLQEKGSQSFKAVTRDKAMSGNRMVKPVSNFGPGHYNICYEASDRHSQTKYIKVLSRGLGFRV